MGCHVCLCLCALYNGSFILTRLIRYHWLAFVLHTTISFEHISFMLSHTQFYQNWSSLSLLQFSMIEWNWIESFELLEQPADWNSSSQAWYHSLQSIYNLGLSVSWEIVKKFDLIAPWIRERRSAIGQSSPNPAFSLVGTMLWVKLCQCIKTICSKLKNNLSVETLNCNLKSSYYRKTFLVFDQNIKNQNNDMVTIINKSESDNL